MSLNYVTITGTFDDGSGSALSGSATFTPSETVYASGVPVVSASNPLTFAISGGTLEGGRLLATDNAGLSFTTLTGFFFWTVSVTLNNVTQAPWSFFLPSSPSTVDLYALAHTTAGGGGGSGTVTSVSVATADGFAGTVANPTTTPAITVETTVTGLLKGNGTAVAAATAGTDYLSPAGGTLTGPLDPKVTVLTDASTVAVNAGLGNDFRLTFTSGVGSARTIGAPSNPVDGQKITFELIQAASGGPYTVTWASGAAGYTFGSGSAPTLSTSANAIDQVAFRYSATKGEWLALGSTGGF